MLQSVQVLPGARRALRRAVHVECDVVSQWWDEPVTHLVTDLSPHGLWLQAPFPLEPGEELIVSLRPPRWGDRPDIQAFAEVRRVELRRRADDPRGSGMGLELLDLAPGDFEALTAALRGLPPPLPKERTPRFPREQVWVDTMLTWEEDLGDRVNTFEVSQEIGLIADFDFEIEPLAELVTGSRPAYRWRVAA